jgi:ADP-ribosylation factor related protein 1
MFSLMSGFYTYLFQKPTYKILLCGIDNAGKTTILEQIKAMHNQKSMNLAKIPPTIGLNIAKLEK